MYAYDSGVSSHSVVLGRRFDHVERGSKCLYYPVNGAICCAPLHLTIVHSRVTEFLVINRSHDIVRKRDSIPQQGCQIYLYNTW